MINKCSSLVCLLTINIQVLTAEIFFQDCPPSPEDEGKNYTIVKEKKTFDDAMEGCRKLGLQLATVNNAEEQRQLVTLLKQQESHTYFRLGGSDRTQPGLFQWESTGEPVEYHAWKKGQPNRYQPGNDKRECICVSSSSEEGKWCVWKCSSPLFYICENQIFTDTCSKCG